MKKLVAFDLDGTLAESKAAIDAEMADLLAGLSEVAQVCVISGGDWPQFEKQVIGRLPRHAVRANLWIMPTSGTKLYRCTDGHWQAVYKEDFSADERRHILDALDKAVDAAGFRGEKIWGAQIEDRGSQITFSGLGQEAPLDAKKAWDPDRKKREAMQQAAQAELPGLSVNIGGSTSIDVTREGVDKAYGIERLAKESGIATADMIFMGDATYPGGNDHPVPAKAGVDTIPVGSIDETKRAIQAIIYCLG
ncbi:HAD-IIB family hydrolase [Sphingomonas abietis]|uniref:phosphomannomutase n=1 Tax=Sphingomonas abietis TaxID=3012344 RepID=A0ABY7NJY8_9SPHN|nr:HAD-IIB family hydrolase [Sphingomonas abietis]WBO21135.1 HAD-IIB family hydrolase [Sphingomonas abietis]